MGRNVDIGNAPSRPFTCSGMCRLYGPHRVGGCALAKWLNDLPTVTSQSKKESKSEKRSVLCPDLHSDLGGTVSWDLPLCVGIGKRSAAGENGRQGWLQGPETGFLHPRLQSVGLFHKVPESPFTSTCHGKGFPDLQVLASL